jgi:putative endonuclease
MKTHADHNYFVYILTNKGKSVLYTGVTNNLKERLYYHNNPLPFSKAFAKRYKCVYLIYYEQFFQVEDAIAREKEIKGWSRRKKVDLISAFNANWKFLNNEV